MDSYPQRHQHVECVLVRLIAHQRRRSGIGEFEQRFLAFDLTGAYTASLVLAALALLTLFVMHLGRLQPREGH